MYKNRALIAIALLLPGVASAATPLSAPPAAPLASSFPGPLWALVAPQGGTASVSRNHLFLNVPGGQNHDALHAANQAVRLVQPIGNVDFDVSLKLDSAAVAKDADTSQGLMVLADDRNFLTLSVSTNGTSITLSGQAVQQGAATTWFENTEFAEYQNPLYLRLRRSGTTYTAYYSVDGAVWTAAGSCDNGQAVTLIGPYAGNYNPNPSRAAAVVMAVNWFHVIAR
jgi:hypothetical protein